MVVAHKSSSEEIGMYSTTLASRGSYLGFPIKLLCFSHLPCFLLRYIAKSLSKI